MEPEDVIPTYERVGATWAAARDQSLFEAAHLRRFLAAAPGPRILDLGCGAGEPIARFLVAEGARVTGIDGAAAMVALFRRTLPGAEVHRADMRRLALGRRFDGILGWDSVFHLSAADQRALFPVLAAHAAPGAALCLTVGPAEGVRIGRVGGAPIHHASLSPEGYQQDLAQAGFAVTAFVPEDPECGGHTVLHAVFRGG